MRLNLTMFVRLQINPYYGKTSMSGLRAHFQALLKEGPAIIYNVPGRTGQDIPDVLVQEMAQHPNFLGMKECTGNKRIGNYTSQVRREVVYRLCCRVAHVQAWQGLACLP
jgi:4-hydroxy-tetrahydrodipicolinate synthase